MIGSMALSKEELEFIESSGICEICDHSRTIHGLKEDDGGAYFGCTYQKGLLFCMCEIELTPPEPKQWSGVVSGDYYGVEVNLE